MDLDLLDLVVRRSELTVLISLYSIVRLVVIDCVVLGVCDPSWVVHESLIQNGCVG